MDNEYEDDEDDDYWDDDLNYCDECDLHFEECICGCEIYCDICGAIEGMCSCYDEEDD